MKNTTTYWQKLYQQSQQVNLDNMHVEHMQLNNILTEPASVDTFSSKWLPSPAKGVKRLVLEREGGEKVTRATSIVAYAPDSQFSAHTHPMGEEFFVLAGTFSDEHGDYPAGTYVRNPPSSSHKPFSREGCLIWVKLQQFEANDLQNIVIDTTTKSVDHSSVDWQRKVLFDQYETVEMVDAQQDFILPMEWLDMGVEILILEGEIVIDNFEYQQGQWLRTQTKDYQYIMAKQNSRFLMKYRHLS